MFTPKRLVFAVIGLVLVLFGTWLIRSATELAWPKFFVNQETLINPTEETKAADLKKNNEWMNREWRYEIAGLAFVGVGSAIILLVISNTLRSMRTKNIAVPQDNPQELAGGSAAPSA
jgi:hypothetical protein